MIFMEEETKVTQETSATEENTAEQETTAEKTFTQEEVNNLLAKERRKIERKATKTQETASPDGAVNPENNHQAEQLNRDLMEAKAQLEAFKDGVAAEMVEDAVYLAMREVEKAGGEPDSDSIREALKIVLKRHPDFKSKEQKGGIKLGAPNEEKQPANEKALPHGKVIF